MPFIYITGAAGTGKSFIAQELAKRGFEAYDEDAAGVGASHNKHTGEVVKVPAAADRTPKWFEQHKWRVLDQAFDMMKAHAKDKAVFLCGNTFTGDAMWQTFDKVIYLKLNEATLRQRIRSRTDNDYGKNEDELLCIIKRQREMESYFNTSRALIIDASLPIETTITTITKP